MVYKEIRPLFNSSFYNPVFDSKDGNLLNLAQIINQNSYSLAYLYAHWNLPSRNKREIIQKLESELNQTVCKLKLYSFFLYYRNIYIIG
jgi:hypothetical protein